MSKLKIKEIRYGHRDFKVEIDHNMSIREASSRRDFTINSISRNILTSEIFDPFGGRFNLVVDIPTAEMCCDLSDEFKDLSIERIWTEFHKWASKSKVPFGRIQTFPKELHNIL